MILSTKQGSTVDKSKFSAQRKGAKKSVLFFATSKQAEG